MAEFPKLTIERPIAYREALCAFIDILGFKELIKNSSPNEIFNLFDLISYSNRIERKAREFSNRLFRSYMFSDSIVLIYSKDKGQLDALDVSNAILSQISLQSQLARLGIWIRGCLTIGDVFFDENVVFGPAIIRAYEIESTLAKNPRIVIDDSICERFDLTNLLDFWDESLKPINERGPVSHWTIKGSDIRVEASNSIDDPDLLGIIKAADGSLHAHYLGQVIRSSPFGHVRENAKRMRTFLQQDMMSHQGNVEITRKLNWLKGYYNRTLLQLDPSQAELSDLLLEE